MRHVNYARWAEYVTALFSLADPPQAATPQDGDGWRVKRVLELACGTGQLLSELARSGYRVYGCDRAQAMVAAARRRLLQHGLPACVWCADMRAPVALLQVDAALCLYDSINYCLEEEDLRRLLTSVAQVVRQGGLFIFDVCTQHNCRRNFRNYVERDATADYSYTRYARYQPRQRLQYNDFTIIDEANRGRIIREQHIQRIYALKEIRALIDASNWWREAACFSGMSRRTGSEKAERVHFVLKRIPA
ncbi:MAG: class I SAM-dependent methyltransferase [candidate division KSB1 bacterium]|nr:class I SAM-dependent methyltransferase [candidate division KSB1 bacterium]MDZ7284998.1 class I SAM-dependent methyltransferase [candidate division KSB1 bacterium]MDZ7297581.1 class I SAM-dependent methyltransferase [candidate division KSB1 bacterium]MDZ7308840.1 class I SAM-dependent methyltransferase [candidate division KSB1 bacterium]MDZ7348448.1 class I SAM-dependent methyltransferase [candidate division KSB1 bacterium]